MTLQRATFAGALCALGLLAAAPVLAQADDPAPALKRVEVFRDAVAAPGHEAVVMRVELAPGRQAGRHTHPGDEISYVTEGEGVLLVDGEPPRHLKAGDAFVIKAGRVHDARNDSAAPMHLLGVYVVEKGKPLATPVK
ncbi:cupin domain-containing protein [Massilia agilis]|uniref:Cupin domain-containing protein n=1 Tax=Massilia agilis TaxID=1811226 RepID=A0ABT2D5H9_9BURK|nr:cupin domain-containing protein [Massilia agilis]MCS0806572.1 cupin domain-containing protein [Massilia agilis]